MSRLIDADELKERFCEENCGKNRCVDHMDKCAWILSVEESKTVFDVDKVVEQFRRYIYEIPLRLNRDNIPFQVGSRFGLIKYSNEPVEFYFDE